MPKRKPVITSIRGRLALLSLGLLVPGLLIGSFLLWDSYNNSRLAMERQLGETARALSLVVDRQLGQAAALNRALATSPYLREGNLKAFDRQARQAVPDSATWIVVSDESGQQLVNTRIEPGAPLRKLQPDPELWRKLKAGGTDVSNLLTDVLPGEPVIAVRTPIEIDGSMRYALSFVMQPAVLNKILADQKLPEGWVGNIIDGDNNVVARSQRPEEVVGRKPSDALIRELEVADQGIVESFSFEGVATLVAFSRSPAYRWTFAVAVPRAMLLDPITGTLTFAAGGALGLMALGAMLSMWIGRSISRPIEELAQSALALGRGEPLVSPNTSIREVRAVGRSLQNAAHNLVLRDADLRESESRLRLAVEATNLGIWDVDLKSGKRIWSAELRKILGLSPDSEAREDLFGALLHPDDSEWVLKRYREFYEPGSNGQYDAEFRIIRSDGEERWVNTSGRMTFDPDGKPLRASGTLMDVTERRRAEEILRESEERFRTMADTAPTLIWLSDAEGQIVFVSRRYELMFGRPAADMLGSGWTDIVLEDDLPAFNAAFLEAFENRAPFRREVRVRDANGTTRWLRCEGAPRTSGSKGEFLGYVGCNIDITEGKLTADALERRIEERTGELGTANRQLIDQIEERERVEETLRQVQRLEAIGQLTSGVAHDFNNLLTVILGNLSFAERGTPEPQLAKRLANMRMAAERGASLVAQLLAFSRRQRLEPKATNLNETVAGMRELLQSSMGGSVAVEIRLDDDLWPALVDPTQMELIILNLAINARDAMEVGGLLKVETGNARLEAEPERPEEPAPGDYVIVSVTDSGGGMSEEVLARVFEPFFTTKEVGKGSGLGLSQVLGFAQQSGGGVRIETREGRGTTVKVFLPRAPETLDSQSAPRAIPPAPSAQAPAILLVDDDDLVREVTSSKLEEFGYGVIQASNGPAALLALEENPEVDILILDFAMPGMNGAEVARAARKRKPGVPIMFVTGYADLTALGEFAAEPVLHKPFRDEDLGQRVADILKEAHTPHIPVGAANSA